MIGRRPEDIPGDRGETAAAPSHLLRAKVVRCKTKAPQRKWMPRKKNKEATCKGGKDACQAGKDTCKVGRDKMKPGAVWVWFACCKLALELSSGRHAGGPATDSEGDITGGLKLQPS